MDTRESSARGARETATTGNRGRYERGAAIASRRRGYSYPERPAHLGSSTYAVPSCSVEGVRYRVDLDRGTCECRDYARGHTCKHLICAEILASRRRVWFGK
jgi:hypothetical protein